MAWRDNLERLPSETACRDSLQKQPAETAHRWFINPILDGGGHYGPDDHKSFCRFQSTRVRLTKLFDFVISNLSFNWVKSVFPFVFEFFEKSRREKFRHPNWLGVKKIFGSDSAQISCVKSLGHKDFKFWVSSKSETKNFFFPKVRTFDVFLIFKVSISWKTSKGPWEKKNFFVSDSAQISCVKSLGYKNFKFWVLSKSETKKFFPKFSRKIQRGDPSMSKNFLSPILLKFHVWNP